MPDSPSARARYAQLAHQIQSAIAFELAHEMIPHSPGTIGNYVKHLRTGLNCIMRDHASLVELLTKKGLISNEEYTLSVLAGLQEEIKLVTEIVQRRTGASATKFTFG